MTFGEKIRANRLKKGLLAKDVAKLLRISVSYLSQLESDRAIPSEALTRKLAAMFAQDPDELVFLARRSKKDLDAVMRSSPRSAAEYLARNVAKPDNKIQEGQKTMVRLI